MIIAYPLKTQQDYTELMYSLRSIEKFVPGNPEVVIIGELLPSWITNITWIELGDVKGKKQLSIRRKILAALEYSAGVFMMNDDIYLTQTTDINNFPYYYYKSLKSSNESGGKSLMKQLEDIGVPIKNFDSNSHYPIRYRSEEFKIISSGFSEDCTIKSMYCNYLYIEGIEIQDCKVINEKQVSKIGQYPCFSTGVASLQACVPILDRMFPDKSKFEL